MSQHFLELYQEALTGLKTGGMALEASLQEIEEGKQQAIAGGQQALVSGGLAGTTMAAGVPIQAEKIAGRQRLGARGRAEQTYLTTLASFAAFSQRGIEAQKQRDFQAEQAGLERRFRGGQAELGRIAQTGTTQYGEGDTWGQYDPNYMQTLFGGGGDEYAQQFPSLYDQGGIGTAPSLFDGGGITGGGASFGVSLEEQGWRGAQVIGEKGVLAGAPTPSAIAPTGAPAQPDQTQIDAEYAKFLADVRARGSYVTSGTKQRWMKQQGYA